MKRTIKSTALSLTSAHVLANSDAYDAGFKLGQIVGRAIPYLAFGLLVLGVFYAVRTWRNRS